MKELSGILTSKKPVIMGVLNLTPDSFSDGGKYNNIPKALKRVEEMIEEGVDIIDIGGESSGPGSENVSLEDELNRVIPAIKEIRKITGLPLSIDTYKSKTALEALNAGADIVNDVTAMRGDKDMARVVSEYGCPVVLMYSKDGTARTTIKNKKYIDVIETIKDFWNERIDYSRNNGILEKNIILDPGMGHFVSSIPSYSYEIIARLPELTNKKFPILIGASRKSFLGGSLENRDKPSLVAAALAYFNGASIIRTHDVGKTKKFLSKFNQT